MIEPLKFSPKTFDSACVEGTRFSRLGYSVVFSGDQKRGDLLLHRVVWEKEHGEIPDGVVIHHECGNRRCINLEHLADMTRSEHMRLHRLGKRKCDHGEGVRYRWSNGSTGCMTCRREKQRERRRLARCQ